MLWFHGGYFRMIKQDQINQQITVNRLRQTIQLKLPCDGIRGVQKIVACSQNQRYFE